MGVSGCSTSQTDTSTTSTDTSTQENQDTQDGQATQNGQLATEIEGFLSMQMPTSWTSDIEQSDGFTYYFLDDAHSVIVMTKSWAGDAQTSGPDATLDVFVNETTASHGNAELLSLSNDAIDGTVARDFVCTGDFNGKSYKFHYVAVATSSDMAAIALCAPADQYQNSEDAFAAIVSSIQVN